MWQIPIVQNIGFAELRSCYIELGYNSRVVMYVVTSTGSTLGPCDRCSPLWQPQSPAVSPWRYPLQTQPNLRQRDDAMCWPRPSGTWSHPKALSAWDQSQASVGQVPLGFRTSPTEVWDCRTGPGVGPGPKALWYLVPTTCYSGTLLHWHCCVTYCKVVWVWMTQLTTLDWPQHCSQHH